MRVSTLSGTRMGADTIWNHSCSHSQKRQKDAVKQESGTSEPRGALRAAVWRGLLSFFHLVTNPLPFALCAARLFTGPGHRHLSIRVTSTLAGGDSAPHVSSTNLSTGFSSCMDKQQGRSQPLTSPMDTSPA